MGIAIGVALLFASQISSTSLAHSVAQLNTELVGDAQYQLDTRGPEGISAKMAKAVAATPGVTSALPILERQVSVVGPKGERAIDLIGVEPQDVRSSGPLLRRFSAHQLSNQSAIALPTPIANGIGVGALQTVKLQIDGRTVETLVGATLQQSDIGALIHSPIAVTSLRYAQQLTGGSTITRVFIHVNPRRLLSTAAPLQRIASQWHMNLVSGHFDTTLFDKAVEPEQKSELLFSGISALVGFMFALNAMLITVPSRRKLIEGIVPHGGTTSMAVQILVIDALMLGSFACLVGLLLGDALSIAVFRSSPGYLSFAFPIGNDRIVTVASALIAVASGYIAAFVGVFWPLRRALSWEIPFSLVNRQWVTARVSGGVVALAITTEVLIFDVNAAVIGNVTLVIALLCFLPTVFDVIVGAVDRLKTDRAVAPVLAVQELHKRDDRLRALAIAGTAALAVFAITEFSGTQSNLTRGLDSSIRGLDGTAAVWIVPRGGASLQNTIPFAQPNAGLSRIPGVRQVGLYRGSFLNWGERRLWIIAPPATVARPIPATQVQAGYPAVAQREVREGQAATLSTALAAQHHLHVGNIFTLPAPHPLTLRVAALTTNLGWPPGAVVMSASAYVRGWSSSQPSALELQGKPGFSAATLRVGASRALGPGSALAAETTIEREHQHFAAAEQGLSRLSQIRLLVLVAATFAVVIALGAMIWQRRDLIAGMKCHGYSEALLWRWLLCESVIVLTAGCLAGAVFGLYAQVLGSHFLATVTGFPVDYGVEVTAALVSFALLTVIAAAVLTVPGYRAVRVPARAVNLAG